MEENDFSISTHFRNLDDPRKYNVRLNLIDIITIAICALICGAQNWLDVEQYGKSKYDWLKQFLQLPGNIPSHDTFGRVFSMLDPKQFTDAFIGWAKSIQALIGQIAIDGKTLKASHDKALEKGAISIKMPKKLPVQFEDTGKLRTALRLKNICDCHEGWGGNKTWNEEFHGINRYINRTKSSNNYSFRQALVFWSKYRKIGIKSCLSPVFSSLHPVFHA